MPAIAEVVEREVEEVPGARVRLPPAVLVERVGAHHAMRSLGANELLLLKPAPASRDSALGAAVRLLERAGPSRRRQDDVPRVAARHAVEEQVQLEREESALANKVLEWPRNAFAPVFLEECRANRRSASGLLAEQF